MKYLDVQSIDHKTIVSLNRPAKRNAFDDELLQDMLNVFVALKKDKDTRVVILKGHGKHFSAGADLDWMQRVLNYSVADNIKDAMLLANTLQALHELPQPTIASVHGGAFGGGVGLVAACDIAIATDTASFCFSEAALGLIPAVISPYVVQAIGPRHATALFVTASRFDAYKAYDIGLVQQVVSESALAEQTHAMADTITHNAPEAIRDAKALVRDVQEQPINHHLNKHTAELIAKKRVSAEGQQGLQAFLNKTPPPWK